MAKQKEEEEEIPKEPKIELKTIKSWLTDAHAEIRKCYDHLLLANENIMKLHKVILEIESR